jgi:hypothetical protein
MFSFLVVFLCKNLYWESPKGQQFHNKKNVYIRNVGQQLNKTMNEEKNLPNIQHKLYMILID